MSFVLSYQLCIGQYHIYKGRGNHFDIFKQEKKTLGQVLS